MAASYSTTAQTDKDRVRLALGDTGVDGGVFLLSDEEIESQLDTLAWTQAVKFLALALANRFAQYPDEVESSGGGKMKWSERVKQWRQTAEGIGIPNPSTNAPKQRRAGIGLLKVGENKLR